MEASANNITTRKCYREWSPLLRLLSQIPTRVHRNIVGYDLNLTCIGAHSRFLAIGTNAGLVYWYDRHLNVLHRLWCKDRRTPISKVCLVETVDYMLAAGNENGSVTIFQIPKPVDPNLALFAAIPADLSCGKEPECFTVSLSHKSAITALAWSLNGMKLFTGDRMGLVCATEIDFITRTTSSRIISNEKFPIVQLSYLKQLLLISTTERSCLCFTDKNFEITEIGSRPRKMLGDFGGIIFQSPDSKVCCLASRPKMTLYDVSVQDAKVKSTILMKSLIEKSHVDIPLVNPSIFNISNEESECWRVKKFESDSVVVYGSGVFHVIRPFVPQVVASCSGLRRIMDLDIHEDEIFVLEGPRSLIRISKRNDPYEVDEQNWNHYNPLGEEKTEGTGLETVTNLISMDSLVSNIPSLTLSGLGSLFRAETSQEDIRTSPAMEALQELSTDQEFVEHRSPHKSKSKRVHKLEREETESRRNSSQEDEIFGSDSQDGMTTSLSNLRLEFQSNLEEGEEMPLNHGGSKSDDNESRLMRALKLDKYLPSNVSVEYQSECKLDVAQEEMPAFASPDIKEPDTEDDLNIEGKAIGDATAFELPSAPICVKWTGKELLFCDNHGGVFFSAVSPTDEIKTLKWKKAKYSADKIETSSCCDIVWRIHSRCAWAAKVPHINSDEENWTLVRSDVVDIAVTSLAAWIVGGDGSLTVHSQLSHNVPFDLESKQLEIEFFAEKVAACDNLCVVLSSEGNLFLREGISPSCCVGTHWIQIEKSPMSLVAVHLFFVGGFVKLFVRNDQGTILLASETKEKIFDAQLQWYELDLGIEDEVVEVCMSPSHLFLFSPKFCNLVVRTENLKGFMWNKINLHGFSRCKQLIASGIYKHLGLLWILMYSDLPSCGLYYTTFHDGALHAVNLPKRESVLCVGAAPECMWILTSQGRIYIRIGLSNLSLGGDAWKELDVTQLRQDNVRLIHLSLSSDAVWAVDQNGTVWMRLGPPVAPVGDLVPVWIPVDGGATPRGTATINSNIRFVRVYASESGRIVWALDETQKVFVREGIFADFRQGVDWIYIPGLSAIAITISDVAVYALSTSGSIFKRCGVSEKNYIGDKWKRVTHFRASHITTSVCDKLYAVDMEGNANELVEKDFATNDHFPDFKTEEEEDGWDVVKT